MTHGPAYKFLTRPIFSQSPRQTTHRHTLHAATLALVKASREVEEETRHASCHVLVLIESNSVGRWAWLGGKVGGTSALALIAKAASQALSIAPTFHH